MANNSKDSPFCRSWNITERLLEHPTYYNRIFCSVAGGSAGRFPVLLYIMADAILFITNQEKIWPVKSTVTSESDY